MLVKAIEVVLLMIGVPILVAIMMIWLLFEIGMKLVDGPPGSRWVVH